MMPVRPAHGTAVSTATAFPAGSYFCRMDVLHEGHWAYFLFLKIMNKAAINIGVQVFIVT